MEIKEYKGKKFTVTIDRNSAQRRYVLNTIEEDGSFVKQNEPLYTEEFKKYFGFSPEWPHETIEDKL